MIASLSQELQAANERIEELEGMNSLLEEELDSFREHEGVIAEEEDDAFPDFSQFEGLPDPSPDPDEPVGESTRGQDDGVIAEPAGSLFLDTLYDPF